MCTPSPVTVTWAPLVQAPPSSLYSVAATPEPPLSVAVSFTTPVFDQPVGASSLVTGAAASMRTVALFSASTVPSASVER